MEFVVSRQFIIHVATDKYLVVDITALGIKPRFRPTKQFSSWVKAEEYFRGLGATQRELDGVWRSFEEIGKAILTIEAAEDDYTPTTG